MLILITGGSGSGKSSLAEKLASGLARNQRADKFAQQKSAYRPIYVATMIAGNDNESLDRITKHQAQRSHLGFTTCEQPFDLELILDQQTNADEHGGIILLECLSNLLANEMFLRVEYGRDYLTPDQAAELIEHALIRAEQLSEHLIVVSNEIFADSMVFDQATREYLKLLGWLNQQLAARAELAIEMVYGLPVIHKGTAEQLEEIM